MKNKSKTEIVRTLNEKSEILKSVVIDAIKRQVKKHGGLYEFEAYTAPVMHSVGKDRFRLVISLDESGANEIIVEAWENKKYREMTIEELLLILNTLENEETK